MYEKLLVAVDHSDITEHVLAAARDLALLASAEVWVLHLREREVMPRAGLIATETVDEAQAKAEDVNVIVMGSRGRGDLAGLVLGSTAHKVIHLADRPVLVVR
jgi:nucleotide-binding universal stress UspA family protein